ncbi:MAG: chemical-damaging agent resistance protein C [Micrococcales bacterium]|nr:MAG: chemical-damaging agent resistance protein C [Micrococcales bacterium]
MGTILSQGDTVSLSDAAGGGLPASVTVGLGWDARPTLGEPFDLDVAALVCGPGGRVLSDQHFVFYNNPGTPDSAVTHRGDSRTGRSRGDDEQIQVRLAAMRADAASVAFVASIYDGSARKQNFGQVRSAYIRVLDDTDGTELARYDLSEHAATSTALFFAEVYRAGSQWRFRAAGEPLKRGLVAFIKDRGVNVIE